MAQTTVPLNTPSEQPTRRTLFGLLAAASSMMSAPTEAGGGSHVVWEQEMRTLAVAWDHCNPEWMAYDASEAQRILNRFEVLEGWIFGQPAQTLRDAAAVIRAAVFVQRQFDREMGCAQLAALERVATLVEQVVAGRA